MHTVGEDGARDTAAFYMDPNQEVGRRILLWATQAHHRMGALSTLPQHPLIVSGLPKVRVVRAARNVPP